MFVDKINNQSRLGGIQKETARSVGWFVSLLVHKEVLLADLCEKKILFQLKIYDRLRQDTALRKEK